MKKNGFVWINGRDKLVVALVKENPSATDLWAMREIIINPTDYNFLEAWKV